MPLLDLEFDVYCSCGERLCNQCIIGLTTHYRSTPSVTVEPCDKCLSNAYDQGYKEGYYIGYEHATKGKNE